MVNLVAFVGIFLALCLLNRPRFWWQEQIVAVTPYWIALAIVAAIFLAYALFRSPSDTLKRSLLGLLRKLYLAIAVCSYGYVLAVTTYRVLPYIYYPSSHKLMGYGDTRATFKILWIDGLSSSDTLAEIAALRAIKDVHLSVVSSAAKSKLNPRVVAGVPLFETAPFVEQATGGEIALYSHYPFGPRRLTKLGVAALPGALFEVLLSNDLTIELGVMTLLPALSAESLEQSRITSRRLASLMRSSQGPRVVIAQFNTTPFSQLRGIYLDQVKLVSLSYGRRSPSALLLDLPPFNAMFKNAHSASAYLANRTAGEVLVSKDIVPVSYNEIKIAPGLTERGVRVYLFVLGVSPKFGE